MSSLWLFSHPVVSGVWLFVTPWTAARQASLPLTSSRSLPKFMFIASVMPPAISASDALFSFCPQSSPASGTFPMSQLFTSDEQNAEISASTSVFQRSVQGWFPLKLTGLISSLSKELSWVFSSTTVRRHQFFGILPSLWSMKLWAMPSSTTQDGWVTAESSDKCDPLEEGMGNHPSILAVRTAWTV